MKKTLFVTLAMASCSMGATTLEDAIYNTKETSLTLDPGLSSFSALVSLDVDALKGAMIVGSSLAKYTLIDMQDTDGSDIGLQTNYSSENNLIKYSGLYGIWNQSGAYNVGMSAAADGSGMEAASFWTNAVGASAMLTYSYSAGTNAVFTICYANGNTVTLGGSANTSLKGSGLTADKALFDGNFVDEAWVFNTSLSVAEAKALTEAIASVNVPEPTTATLSLLALAGLAARRRRK